MSGLFRRTFAGRMDSGMGQPLGCAIFDASGENELLPAWRVVSVSTVNRGSTIPGTGISFE